MKIIRYLSIFLYFPVLFVIILNIVSCDEGPQNLSKSSITAEGILSGTISNHDPSLVDSILVLDITSSIIGRTKVSDKGFFRVELSTPHLNKGTNVWAPFTVNDSTAYNGIVAGIYIYKNMKQTGRLTKMNQLSYIGGSSSSFYYSTTQNRIKGSISPYSYDNNSKESYECDITLNKGWTETTFLRTDSTSIKLSNHLNKDLKWVIIYMKFE